MSETSVTGIAFSETRLKSVENFVFTLKLLCVVMNNPFNNFWWDGEYWNGAIVFRVSFGAFFKKQFDFCYFTTSRKFDNEYSLCQDSSSLFYKMSLKPKLIIYKGNLTVSCSHKYWWLLLELNQKVFYYCQLIFEKQTS